MDNRKYFLEQQNAKTKASSAAPHLSSAPRGGHRGYALEQHQANNLVLNDEEEIQLKTAQDILPSAAFHRTTRWAPPLGPTRSLRRRKMGESPPLHASCMAGCAVLQRFDHALTMLKPRVPVLLLLTAGLTFRTSSSEASVFIGKRTIKVTHPA